MLSRRRLLVGLFCSSLVFTAAACQAFPVGGAMPTGTAQPTAAVSKTDSVFDSVVWARVPYCACLDGIATDNVSAALQRAQLAGTVKILSPTGGWLYFVVAFDPKTASHEQIGAAIAAGGGEVMAGPP
jgi:hypothetical protein